jgi:hypothetical protein
MTSPSNHKRPWWKWALVFIASVILGFVGYGFLQTVSRSGAHPVVVIIATVVLLGLYALGVKLLEGHWPRDLNLRKLLPHTLTGMLVGFVYMTLVVGTIVAMGCADAYYQDFSSPELWYSFMVYLTVGVGEEMICRGVIFRQIDERWNTWAAFVVSALLFGFMHIFNDGATWWSSLAIAIEAGLMLGAAYKWSGSLWLPIGIHWIWNFTQGNIYGFSVSGTVAGGSVLVPVVDGPEIITGGAFGPEASIIAVFFGVLLTMMFYFNRNRPFTDLRRSGKMSNFAKTNQE